MRLEIEIEVNKLKKQIAEWKRLETLRVNNSASSMNQLVEFTASRLYELVDPQEKQEDEKRLKVVK